MSEQRQYWRLLSGWSVHALDPGKSVCWSLCFGSIGLLDPGKSVCVGLCVFGVLDPGKSVSVGFCVFGLLVYWTPVIQCVLVSLFVLVYWSIRSR